MKSVEKIREKRSEQELKAEANKIVSCMKAEKLAKELLEKDKLR